MKTSTLIAIIAGSLIIMYIITQILTFYEIGTNEYGVYIAFYLFLLLNLLVMPTDNV